MVLYNIIKIRFLILLGSILYLTACDHKPSSTINVEEIVPWCIIGFDTEERTPSERIDMLQNLGIKKYGYNRGKADFTSMKEEFQLADEKGMEITSIFLWLNPKRDSLEKLSPANQDLLHNLRDSPHKPAIWVSFSESYFKDLDQQQSINLSIEYLTYIKKEAEKLGLPMAIYNHNGWFGNPHNQLAILEQMGQSDITMVYNFHHAQEYVNDFSDIAKQITPHLSFVNLNGVKKEGPQIITLGEGEHELDMITKLVDAGYKGEWGILGHIKTEDVEVVLKRNLAGLQKLNRELGSR